MSILVTGSTGTVGSQILKQLAASGADVRGLTRSPAQAQLPAGITAVLGDLSDIDSFRAALEGVTTLFLLAPNVADELTQAMQALIVARETGVKGIVYLSVYKGAAYADVPHFASKNTVEHMIHALALPATVLRPAYFIQNDLRQKEVLTGAGIYAMPVGHKGISMVDVRDIGEIAARELLRRDGAADALPPETFDVVGPDVLTGPAIADIWSDVLGKPIRYGGDDTAAIEQRMKAVMPAWHALDMRLMLDRYQSDGAAATSEELARFTHALGHAPRSYRAFAHEAAAVWNR